MAGTGSAISVFVVSAPSGAGKTTLNRRLIGEHSNIAMSVSCTTRPRRQNEVAGVDYNFVTVEAFKKMIAGGKMLEYAEVFGKYYGTPLSEVQRIRDEGKVAILEIDVQGWRQAREKIPEAVSIFIAPPTIASLWKRLEGRGTEPKEVRWRRLMTARAEITSGNLYRHFIINEDLDKAYEELKTIIIAGQPSRLSAAEGIQHCQKLLDEFDNAPWIKQLARELTAS